MKPIMMNLTFLISIFLVVVLNQNYVEGSSASITTSFPANKRNVKTKKPFDQSFRGLQKNPRKRIAPLITESTVTAVAVAPSAASASASASSPSTFGGALRLFGLFTIWYAFNAGYNVYNSHLKIDFQFPWTSSTLQLIIGLFYAIPLWFFRIRKIPNLTILDILRLVPIAFLNALGHVSAVIAMFEKGGGSFTHVIKASEPVVSVILSLFINGIVPKPWTAISLLPITYGVAYASTLGNINVNSMSKELTTKAAKMAMTSNVAFSLRSIFRKNLSKEFKERTNLNAANEHAVTTFLSSILMIPFVLYFENIPTIIASVKELSNPTRLFQNLFISGICFYLYNELQNIVLSSLGPVPTAVGNTLKRVVIFVALYLFTKGEEFPPAKVLGCAIAIAGCFGFALFDSKKM